jgi:hypothetical protein
VQGGQPQPKGMSFLDLHCSTRARSPVTGDMFVEPIATLFERTPLGVTPVDSP